MTLAELKQQCVTRNLVPVPAETLGAMIVVIEAAQTYSDDMERQGGSNPSNMRSALAQLEKALA